MALDLRPAGTPGSFDLFEGEERIGEIIYGAPEEEGDAEWWSVELWSLTGTGKTWNADPRTAEEAVEYARELYKEFVAERRELNTGPRIQAISTPMGGQPRRR